MTPATSPALVLSGGNALGAYSAGAWSAMEAAGCIPGWVVGTSIGAVTAAIIAGNAPGQRDDALARFWRRASAFDAAPPLLPETLRQPLRYGQALASRVFGRPPLFNLRPPDLTADDPRPSLFDTAPMRALLDELIDCERLNGGDMRVSVVALDLASGQEVVFDTAKGHVGIDHVMASAALIPDFPPVSIGDRLLVDGGLANNLPIDVVLDERATAPVGAGRLACFAVDLFPLAAPLPRGVLQAAQRQSDLIFASQTSRTLKALSRRWEGRAPGADLFLLAYEAMAEETALKGFDFGAGTLRDRRAAGARDMAAQLARWKAGGSELPGLRVHAPPRGASDHARIEG